MKVVYLLFLCLFIFSCINKEIKKKNFISHKNVYAPLPQKEFGFMLSNFQVSRAKVKKDETFGEILLNYKIGYPAIYDIIEKSKDVFNVKKINKRKRYTVLSSKETNKLQVFIYQFSLKDYVVFDFRGKTKVYKGQKKVTLKEKVVYAKIRSSLYETVKDMQLDIELVYKISDIYAWTVDFFKLHKGDYFKVVYDEMYVNDSIYLGVDKIKASYFQHIKKPYYAFSIETDNTIEFYDEEGKNLRKAFLKAPLKFSRITSRFSPKRFHPVIKRWKSHKGTDYAAPRGTPIMATATGIVSRAGYTRGNGNYVKIRHNSVYSTQYLHMSKIKKGIRVGKKINQGNIIGYVGSTGYATGPHVCYRFWKNGKQVNPYKQKLPDSKPIKEKYRYLLEQKVHKYKPLFQNNSILKLR